MIDHTCDLDSVFKISYWLPCTLMLNSMTEMVGRLVSKMILSSTLVAVTLN